MKYCSIPVTHYQQNCSILWCEATMDAAVVDPGGDLSLILERVEELGVNLTKILLTHGHLDHVGATAELASLRHLPIIGPHKDDAFWIDGLPAQANMMGFSEPTPFTPTEWLEEGDTVSVGESELHVLHCPGHTPGHVIFYSAESSLAFVGDVLFHGSIGRSDFPRGNAEDLVRSIREKLFPLGDDVRFIPGHGPESTFGNEREHNPFVADKRFG